MGQSFCPFFKKKEKEINAHKQQFWSLFLIDGQSIFLI
jgi:hypothetical protein